VLLLIYLYISLSVSLLFYACLQVDIAIIFHDLNRPVQKIVGVPNNSLKQWKIFCEKLDILYFQHETNLTWPTIMKDIKKAPKQFWSDGGWANLIKENTRGKHSSILFTWIFFAATSV
jgi:nucleosome binding factor SPN SPT16 subunit